VKPVPLPAFRCAICNTILPQSECHPERLPDRSRQCFACAAARAFVEAEFPDEWETVDA
jgi:hypothetical protein